MPRSVTVATVAVRLMRVFRCKRVEGTGRPYPRGRSGVRDRSGRHSSGACGCYYAAGFAPSDTKDDTHERKGSMTPTDSDDSASATGAPGNSGAGTRVFGRGVLAGIAGGLAMALWFLLVDGSQGHAFRTPAFMASAILGLEEVRTTVLAITAFSAVHFAAWALVGVGVAWLFEKIPGASPVLLGMALGFALFDAVFYGSVAVTGVDVVAELGWPSVLVGNLLGGVVLTGLLHATDRTRSATWWEGLSENRVVREGILSGLMGAAVVAAWFLVVDLLRAEAFFTPAALGSALFLGADSLADVRIGSATVLAYTVVHLLAFVVAGFVSAGFMAAAEETPPLIFAAIMLFIVTGVFFVGTLAVLAEFLLGALAWWSVALGTLLAAAVMIGYLWRLHPKLREALTDDPLQTAG